MISDFISISLNNINEKELLFYESLKYSLECNEQIWIDIWAKINQKDRNLLKQYHCGSIISRYLSNKNCFKIRLNNIDLIYNTLYSIIKTSHWGIRVKNKSIIFNGYNYKNVMIYRDKHDNPFRIIKFLKELKRKKIISKIEIIYH